MQSTAFFITRKLFKEKDGDAIITPAVIVNGEVIIEEFVVVPRIKQYYPKIKSLYNTQIGYVGVGGWISCKYNADYYVIKVFADAGVHRNVIINLTNEFGIYLGATIEEARQKIDTTPFLNQLITSSNMTGGTIR